VIAAEQAKLEAELAHAFERARRFGIRRVAVEVGVKEVFPSFAGARTRLELREVDLGVGEQGEDLRERACLVARGEQERRWPRCGGRRGRLSGRGRLEEEKEREVVGVVGDV